VKSLQRLDQVKPEHHNWIWADRIARQEIHFVAGKPDVGKGMMLAKIVADVSWGRDAFTGDLGARSEINPKQPPLKAMNVLYSAAEDGAGTMIRPRLEAQGVNRKNIHLKRFRLPLDFAEMADIIVDKQIDLVVIDPLASSLSGGIGRFTDAIRQVTDPLKELLEATDCAALFVDHVRKRVGINEDPLAAVGGASSGFPAATRMGFLFGKDPQDDEKAYLSCVKSNIRIKPMSMAFEIDSVETSFDWDDVDTGKTHSFEHESVPKLIVQGEDYFNPIRLVANEKSHIGRGRPADKRAQACEWLTTYLFTALSKQDGSYPVLGTTVQEDALQFGMSYRTLRRAADEMKIVKSGKGGSKVTWALPDAIINMLVGEIDASSDDDVVAEPPVEEPALEQMLDQGQAPSDDPTEWERNKQDDDVTAYNAWLAAGNEGTIGEFLEATKTEDDGPSAEFDAEFDSFLANLEDGEAGNESA
jgi:hypothetical protein